MLARLKFLTSGESHGKGLLGILDGFPAGLEISEKYIQDHLARRQKGHGRGGRMKIETDKAEIWSGVRHGFTIGSPVGLLIRNKDHENWLNKMSTEPVDEPIKKVTLPRPGHADLAGVEKFGFDDIRNVLERSSARETAMRVAIGSICRKLLEEVGIEVGSRVIQIHTIKDETEILYHSANEISERADLSTVRVLDGKAQNEMVKAIDEAKAAGDSLGGIFEVFATGLPYGLGSYTQWDRKLHARISAMIMSVNAFKGIEFGAGFSGSDRTGAEFHDEIGWDGEKYTRLRNNSGGLEGGMTTAQPLIIKAFMKPIPTLIKPLKSVDILTKEQKDAHKERTDACAVPAASVIAESMLCIVLADALLEKFGGDSVEQLKAHLQASAKY